MGISSGVTGHNHGVCGALDRFLLQRTFGRTAMSIDSRPCPPKKERRFSQRLIWQPRKRTMNGFYSGVSDNQENANDS